jgi:glucosamine-6-phosphate deaminase
LQPIVLADDLAVGQYAAEIIFTELVRASSEGRPFVLGCPGGRTPRSTYKALAAMVKANQQDISHLVIAMMDEYLQENADGSQSNHSVIINLSSKSLPLISDIFIRKTLN